MKPTPQGCNRNDEVRQIYHSILKFTKQLLSTVERDELRYTLIRDNKHSQAGVVHELISPIVYLRLEIQKDNNLSICYGLEACAEYMHLTMPFARNIYRVTMRGATTNDIEDSISTRYYVHNPDELYAYMEDRYQYHTLEIIKYKPATKQLKRLLRVA